MEEFKLVKFTDEGIKLLEDVKQTFKKLQLDPSGLPTLLSNNDDKIKLVFVGQYSAGKSSIIKMLTGEDVEIGAKITTQSATPYIWHGLEIIDTPGIETELRPDHDEITKDQISHAALLIFVITYEGFSQHMGDYFRKLAIEQKRAPNMVLVVNKMDMTALGNVPEQQKIIADDMEKVTAPYKTKDLYLSFLDTSAYFDSLDEEDKEIKDELFNLSGHDVFVKNLNEFVKSHEILAKLTKPLYTISDELRKNMKTSDSSTTDNTIMKKELINRKKTACLEVKRNCLSEIKDIAEKCRREINQQGREVVEIIQFDCNKEEVERKLTESQSKVNEIVEQCNDEIINCINNSLNQINEEIKLQDNSNLAVQLRMNMQSKIDMPTQNLNTFNNVNATEMTNVGKYITEKGLNATAIASGNANMFSMAIGQVGAKSFSGSNLHVLIKDGAKFLGHKFQPWGAINLTKSISSIGAAIGVIGAVYGLYSALTSGDKQREAEEKLKKARDSVKNDFMSIGEEVFNKIMEKANDYMRSNINLIIDSYDKELKEIQDNDKRAIIVNDNLNKLLNRTQNLIDKIVKNN